jgi:hypothetical protein
MVCDSGNTPAPSKNIIWLFGCPACGLGSTYGVIMNGELVTVIDEEVWGLVYILRVNFFTINTITFAMPHSHCSLWAVCCLQQCYTAYGDIWNKEMSFQPFPGKAAIESRGSFENLWGVCLWQHSLHYEFIL